ncbi:GNAT family N-acetyltransferase [Bordetella pseudohinzii]|uniref:GCN5 family acetyltransferase n=1 Tax=Bordetella pseudohinzii TaxID=1331258 RepID=A0A0J6C3X7_9BORD|nr:GNAT family N-acetyltransferase [Bordetella pseudohinzii]ANY16773.1 GCN5 family acetyltransferase [Bordetella pseudohinzii]KMM25476.1 GCN5 family acetyltransferase [Bordetella pseudohinzii]KXA76261.1 GCN5 family acetyltransferase [Bordetella pseudohinzii]KXA76836.1 GCN5 family acetyltransferase [Bordetella pseudohinzii]CUI90941.1 Uncharacterized N-acetyltransferase YsnE [Bordetella pseudohinzii]
MNISPENARTPDVAALIAELDAYQIPLSPPESHHGVDLDALCSPGVVFLVARDEAGQALGCGGIQLNSGYAELKRMYVRPAARGQGVAQALLARLQTAAADAGIRRIHLETGARQAEALAFYRRQGYTECPPFGDYRPDPHSVFMVKVV